MVIALLSDVHGNAVGLEAVLGELEALSPDRVVCLGDVAGWDPSPASASGSWPRQAARW
jgi:predicted phosphodiesterase